MEILKIINFPHFFNGFVFFGVNFLRYEKDVKKNTKETHWISLKFQNPTFSRFWIFRNIWKSYEKNTKEILKNPKYHHFFKILDFSEKRFSDMKKVLKKKTKEILKIPKFLHFFKILDFRNNFRYEKGFETKILRKPFGNP